MTDVKQLSEERFQINQNIYSGKLPSRIPFTLGPAFEASIAYAIKQGSCPRRENHARPLLGTGILV